MLERRPWVPAHCEDLVQNVAGQTAKLDGSAIFDEIARLVAENRRIHDLHGINLNPASNVMNPRAEAMMASGLGSRASLGYPGDKYEMGLEAIERIEVIAAELAAEVFDAKYAEVRVASGALANLYVFMATCKPIGPTCSTCPPSSRRSGGRRRERPIDSKRRMWPSSNGFAAPTSTEPGSVRGVFR